MVAKRTLYVSRTLTNASDVAAWAKEQGITNVLSPSDMHVTIAYSKDVVVWHDGDAIKDSLTVPAGDRHLEKLGDGKVLVLCFESDALQSRWRSFRDSGASWDWPGYKPHVSLSYDGKETSIDSVAAYDGPLEFGPESFAELDEDWTPDVVKDEKIKANAFALDRASVRSTDDDGHLHVARTPISKANVCPYFGREVPDAEALGLDPNKTYKLYRDADELAKAADSFNGKPLLFGHHLINADNHDHSVTVGSVTGVEWDAPYLYARLDIWPSEASRAIDSGEHEQLSCAYRYKAIMEAGIAPDGTPYDGRMVAISGSHVAIVPEGRAGPDVVVLDASLVITQDWITMAGNKPTLSRPAKMAAAALDGYLKKKLASGVALDAASFMAGVSTGKTYRAQLPALVANIKTKTAGKLATDADIEDVAEVLEAIAPILEMDPEDMPLTNPDDDDSANDDDDAALKAALKAKGYSDEEIEAICAKSAMPAPAAATDADKDAEKKKDDDVKAAQDAAIAAAVREVRKDMVPRSELDKAKADTAAAIKNAIQVATDSAIQRQREVRDAEVKVTRVVGVLAVAQDSADDWYRAGLNALNVPNVDTLDVAALRPMFELASAQKNAPVARAAAIAADAAPIGKSFKEMFPESKRFLG